jgi:hypothetical protein
VTATVRNISESGAILQVESTIGIPDEFTLFIEADHFKRTCQIIWRQPTKLGVRFL